MSYQAQQMATHIIVDAYNAKFVQYLLWLNRVYKTKKSDIIIYIFINTSFCLHRSERATDFNGFFIGITRH